ncbi:U11/U12 small nuclear ribonucleoprotein 48 kDa protein-like [Ochlerotatus camptorhynchus]|uniref:U11/U12 small nuclear ribonucleoprotein 48 kDa protein-like n=1 Tax=Ochlerotatus camptorhynchus TaxID=644619 RepID=UPI0031E3EFE3
MEQRRVKLSSITTFIENTTETIDKFLEDFGWDRDKLLKEYNNGTQQIGLKKDSNEDSFPESFYDEQHQCSVKMDEHTQATIIRGVNNENPDMEIVRQTEDILATREIPSSHKDLLVNFTREERLALYRYAVESTPKQEPLPEFQISFKKRDNLAKLTPLAEIAAYRRDIRRRNQKYRVAKNPLTYQEEMHNLIQLQTEALAEYLGQSPVVVKSVDKTSQTKAEGTPRTGTSRTRSRSRDKIRKRRDGDDSGRSKDAKHKKRKRSRSRSRSGHKHKSKKSKRDDSRERSSARSKHKSRH